MGQQPTTVTLSHHLRIGGTDSVSGIAIRYIRDVHGRGPESNALTGLL
ncbi:hypothetical protein [Streptomyces sp. bgisy082]